ncbi:MAG: hypothetical protein ACHQ2Y_05945, partial [Candidatus Lutacidiplasmatales archaeon]
PPPPPPTTPGTPASPPTGPVSPPNLMAPGKGLISLERPFDVDEFAQLLGETSIRVVVPREELSEVLRRVVDFMGFGIYVYSLKIRPAPEELLKSFVLELQRVDFSSQRTEWIPFEDKGRSESPFGPGGRT